MKKILIIPFIILFFLSACTFLFPAETNITIAKIDHPDDGNLILYLRHADEGYYVTVNGVVYDCVMVDDTLKCSGPSLQPGEKAVERLEKPAQGGQSRQLTNRQNRPSPWGGSSFFHRTSRQIILD